MNNCIHTHISITYGNIENFMSEKPDVNYNTCTLT